MKTFLIYLAIGCVAIAATFYFLTTSHSQRQDLANGAVPGTTTPSNAAAPGFSASTHLRGVFSGAAIDGAASAIDADANHVGVRDDVDAAIKRKYPDGEQRRAFFQYARAEQRFISGGGSPEGARQGIQDIDKAIQCLRAKAPAEYRVQSKELLALLLNTPQSFGAYAQATKNLGGQVVPGYSGGNPCD